MTSAGILQIVWARKGWIAAPFGIATVVAALVGWGLSGRETYRASCLLGVTEGAHAQAVFACRSLDVLEAVLESPGFKDTRRRHATAASFAEDVTVTVLGEGRFKLEVNAPSAAEAKRLVAGVAAQAGRSVRILSEHIRKEDEGRIRDLEDKLERAQSNVDAPERERADLKIRHHFDVGPGGDLISHSRARLADIQAQEAELGRQLAGINAELAALRAGGAQAHVATLRGGAGRNNQLSGLDAEILRLRENLTDLHPRLAKLLAERARAAADLARPIAQTGARAESGRNLGSKEGERARVVAILAATARERAKLADSVRTEAANAEELARRLSQRVESARAEVARSEQLLEDHKDAADRNREAKAALGVIEFGKARLFLAGPSVGWLALAGAGLGLMIGSLMAALAEALDPAIRCGDGVAKQLGLPVLATVPSPGDSRAGAHWTGTVAWLAVFLLVATFLIMLVYPGWGRLKAAFSRSQKGAVAEEMRR